MSRHRWVALVLLVVLAVATRLLLISADDRESDGRLPQARSDYSLDHFELVAMDDNGLPRFAVSAPRLERLPNDGSARVDTPFVELFEAGEVSWTINAEAAWIADEASEIRLTGDVDLAGTGGQQTQVATEALVVFPDRQAVATDFPVLLQRGSNHLQGTGLRALLEQDRWELMSDVKATFRPPQQ